MQHQGETIHLEPKVMQVLLVLASNPGEVFTREEIRDVVWRDVFVGDDVLMRAVSEIRRVFNDDPRTPHTVQTVPKVGYRLIAPVAPIAPTLSRTSLDRSALAPIVEAESAPVASPTEPVPVFESVPGPALVAQPASAARSRWPLWLGAAILTLILLVVLGRERGRMKHPDTEQSLNYISHPLTTYPVLRFSRPSRPKAMPLRSSGRRELRMAITSM